MFYMNLDTLKKFWIKEIEKYEESEICNSYYGVINVLTSWYKNESNPPYSKHTLSMESLHVV